VPGGHEYARHFEDGVGVRCFVARRRRHGRVPVVARIGKQLGISRRTISGDRPIHRGDTDVLGAGTAANAVALDSLQSTLAPGAVSISGMSAGAGAGASRPRGDRTPRLRRDFAFVELEVGVPECAEQSQRTAPR
jgi:hypothetical protein